MIKEKYLPSFLKNKCIVMIFEEASCNFNLEEILNIREKYSELEIFDILL